MKKTIVIFGLIAGIIPSAMFWVLNPEGDFSPEQMDNGQIAGYITMLLAFSTIFFAVKSVRDNHTKGSIKFGKAFLIGLYITLIATVIYAVSWEIYTTALEVNFAKAYREYTEQALIEEGKSVQEISNVLEENASMMEMYEGNFFYRFVITMLEIFPVGLIVSLISALLFSFILKKQQ